MNQAPDYPMQMMVAVFDFPDKPGPADHVPEFAVDWVRGGAPPLSTPPHSLILYPSDSSSAFLHLLPTFF